MYLSIWQSYIPEKNKARVLDAHILICGLFITSNGTKLIQFKEPFGMCPHLDRPCEIGLLGLTRTEYLCLIPIPLGSCQKLEPIPKGRKNHMVLPFTK
jgi:hypothetical protein